MKRYLYLFSSDSKHMERRLDALARKGLELIAVERVFTGEFKKSSRQDLSYAAIPMKHAAALPPHFDPLPYGYELVGGYNNMALFKALPCAKLDRERLEKQIFCNEGIQTNSMMRFGPLIALLIVTVFFFLLSTVIPFYQRGWYLSYSGICVHLLRWFFTGLLGVNLILLPSYLGAWLRGLTPWITSASILAGVLLGLLDLRQDQGVFLLLAVGIAIACLLGLWRLCKGIGAGIAAFSALILVLGLMFPQIDAEQMSGTGLRSMAAKAPVLTLASFRPDEPLEGSEYQTRGTLLAKRYSYTEVSAEASLSTETYCCADRWISNLVVAELKEYGRWQETELEETWISASGKTALLRAGTEVSLVSYSEYMDLEQLSMLRETLFSTTP